MENRRTSDRCPAKLACRVSLQAGRTRSGRILDLSREGVRFEFTGPVTAWDGPRVLCYLNGYLLERSLDVRWTRVENDRVV
ncbi:MAG: PilZ domain-containing protein, partial [Candidatus Xenobia bacterium]